MQCDSLLDKDLHVIVDSSSRLRYRPIDSLMRAAKHSLGKMTEPHLKRLDMESEPISHDRDQLGIDLILVLLIVLDSRYCLIR